MISLSDSFQLTRYWRNHETRVVKPRGNPVPVDPNDTFCGLFLQESLQEPSIEWRKKPQGEEPTPYPRWIDQS